MFEELKNKVTMFIKGELKVSKSSPESNGDKGKEEKKLKIKPGKNTFFNMMILFLSGILLVIVSSIFKPDIIPTMGSKPQDNAVQADNQSLNSSTINSSYKEKVENELVTTLEHIDGVGKVEVMIYFEGGEEQVPAFNTNDSTNTTDEKDPSGGTRKITQENKGDTVVMSGDGSKQQPLIVKTYHPKITGMCIVAEGASEKVTELRVRQAVTALFGLSDNKVQVYPMKK
ncbi:stage III sporulation protein AG [Clostridium sp.]|uniref:stage III sporulation protein AG n=1 Tax=Clostridium sp. TaxID=1506 RepID=UPI002FC77B3A